MDQSLESVLTGSSTAVVDAQAEEKVERMVLIFAVPKEFAIPRPGSVDMPINMYRGETRRYVAGLSGANIARGLDLDTEKLVPAFSRKIGVNIDSQNWEQAVKDFWMNYMFQIPFAEIREVQGSKQPRIDGGLLADAGYTKKNGMIYPNNIDHYLLVELMTKDQGDNKISFTAQDYPNAANYQFFCVDKQEEDSRRTTLRQAQMSVHLELSKLITDKENAETLRLIVSLTSEEVSSIEAMRLTREEAMEEIMTLALKDSEKFLRVVRDKELARKSFVKQLVDAGVYTKQGSYYYYNDDLIGDLKQVLLFLKNPDSEDKVRSLENKLRTYKVISAN